MRLPRAKDVPWTAGVSGVVFVLVMFSLGSPMYELAVLGTWGLMYLIECQARGLWRRPVTVTQTGDPAADRPLADHPHGATADGRT